MTSVFRHPFSNGKERERERKRRTEEWGTDTSKHETHKIGWLKRLSVENCTEKLQSVFSSSFLSLHFSSTEKFASLWTDTCEERWKKKTARASECERTLQSTIRRQTDKPKEKSVGCLCTLWRMKMRHPKRIISHHRIYSAQFWIFRLKSLLFFCHQFSPIHKKWRSFQQHKRTYVHHSKNVCTDGQCIWWRTENWFLIRSSSWHYTFFGCFSHHLFECREQRNTTDRQRMIRNWMKIVHSRTDFTKSNSVRAWVSASFYLCRP